MDDYEVDLIDYLRVMWKAKWIILTCLVVALAVSGAIMWTRPNEYSGTVSYRLYQSLFVLGITSVDDQELLNTALDYQDFYGRKGLTLEADLRSGRVESTISGAVSPNDLAQAFDQLASSVTADINAYVEMLIAQATFDTSMQIDQLTRQRDALQTQITALISSAQDDPLLNYLTQKTADLNSAFQYALELQTKLNYLTRKTADLEEQLVKEQVRAEGLENADPAELFTIQPLGEPIVSIVGPNRKMSLAVAGVLGLFVGVLLAFFVHYLISAREKEATHKQT